VRFLFLRAFERTLKSLPAADEVQVKKSVQGLINYFDGNDRPHGLGLRKLREPYWEIRSSLAVRILFSIKGDLVQLHLVGDHDDVRRFLKR